MMKRYLVHATITAEIEVEVSDGQPVAIQKHAACDKAKMELLSRLSRTGITITGVSTGAAWPTEPHALSGHFMEGVMGVPPAGEGGAPRQILEAEVVDPDERR
jgi:hypothetical protein